VARRRNNLGKRKASGDNSDNRPASESNEGSEVKENFIVAPQKYDEGYDSYMAGKTMDDCPYPVGTRGLRFSWLSGWLQARADRACVSFTEKK
jgi:ribosome modulation factor